VSNIPQESVDKRSARELIYDLICLKRKQNVMSARTRRRAVPNREVDFSEAFCNLYMIPNNLQELNMANPVVALQINAANPVFASLEPAIQAYLNIALVQKVTQVQKKVVTVTNVDTNIKVPVYDTKKMTSGTFFRKLRSYFATQGYDEAS